MKTTLILLSAFVLLVSCNGRQDSTTSSDDTLATSAEDAVTTLSALLDDESNEAYATNHKKSYQEILQDIVIPKAHAANCIRPVNLACDNGVKSSTFEDCSSFRGLVVASGNITLDYSQNDCSMGSDGDQVARTYNYEIVGPRGGQLDVSSDDHEDYRGNTIGGGAVLTNTAAGHSLEILGKHKVFTRNGNIRRDRSIRTTEPLEISGGLRRSVRQVNNGQLEIIHNLAEFTATYTAEDVVWSSSCCHPVSGSLSVEYTGSVEGTASITFNSCGQAEIERNGETSNVEFTYCE